MSRLQHFNKLPARTTIKETSLGKVKDDDWRSGVCMVRFRPCGPSNVGCMMKTLLAWFHLGVFLLKNYLTSLATLLP